MKHFSHPHELELWITPSFPSHQQTLTPADSTTIPPCSACQLPPTETMYICRPCNFSLHLSCAQLPQVITHPAHKNHALTLLPVAAYPGGVFNCDACNRRGNGFSYHCGSCEYDLHVLCASKPLKFTHPSHFCQLELTFTNPYRDTKGFSCDVCHKFGSKQWLYRCSACEFDVHLDCTTVPTTSSARVRAPASSSGAVAQFQTQGMSQTPAPVGAQASVVVAVSQFQGQDTPQQQFLDPHGSFSARYVHSQVGLAQAAQPAHQQYMHFASMGAHPIIHRPQLGPSNTDLMGVDPVMHGPPAARPDVFMHSASTGQLRQVVRPDVWMDSSSSGQLGNVAPAAGRTSGLMNSVIQGIVEGAAQQVGQSLVQGVIGGRGGGGGGGGDGTSILGSLFEDSSHTQN